MIHRRAIALFALVVSVTVLSRPRVEAQDASFLRGDVNADSNVDISDPVGLLGILFLGGVEPAPCDDAYDGNDSGTVDLSDAVYVLNFLFTGGPALPAPFPDCGADPTADGIECDTAHPSCPPATDCFDDERLNQLIDENVPPVTCVAPDVSQLDFEGLFVEICPSSEAAADCDGLGNPGCPIQIDSVDGTLDIGARVVRARVTGFVDSLPVRVTNIALGQTVVCALDIDFSGTAVVPIETARDADDKLVVVGVGFGTLEDVEVDLSAQGGLLCSLIVTLQDLFIEDLIGQLETASNVLLEDLNAEIIGQEICEEE